MPNVTGNLRILVNTHKLLILNSFFLKSVKNETFQKRNARGCSEDFTAKRIAAVNE